MDPLLIKVIIVFTFVCMVAIATTLALSRKWNREFDAKRKEDLDLRDENIAYIQELFPKDKISIDEDDYFLFNDGKTYMTPYPSRQNSYLYMFALGANAFKYKASRAKKKVKKKVKK